MKRIAACILLLALPASGGNFFRGNPLLDLDVVQWSEPFCTESAVYSAEWRVPPSEVWVPIPFGGNLDPNDGIAYQPGVGILFRACCVRDSDRDCIDAGPEPVTKACPNIYSVGGGAYKPEDVAGWNAQAVMVEPTPAPTPPPGPALGACCLDVDKPWACGQAIENTCLNILEGGWKWVEGEQCSNELCQGE